MGKRSRHVGQAITGRRQALADIADRKSIAQAADKAKQATDAVWPTNDTKEG